MSKVRIRAWSIQYLQWLGYENTLFLADGTVAVSKSDLINIGYYRRVIK